MPHEDCVNLIKRSGNTLALKVVTANMSSIAHSNHIASQSLPYRRKGKSFENKKTRETIKIYFSTPSSQF